MRRCGDLKLLIGTPVRQRSGSAWLRGPVGRIGIGFTSELGLFGNTPLPALSLGLALLFLGEFLLALLESVVGLRHLAPSKGGTSLNDSLPGYCLPEPIGRIGLKA